MMGYSTDQGSIPCGISTLTGMHRPVGTDSYRHVERWFLTSFPTTPAGTSNVLTRRACTGTEEAPDVISVRGFFLCVGPVGGGLVDGDRIEGCLDLLQRLNHSVYGLWKDQDRW